MHLFILTDYCQLQCGRQSKVHPEDVTLSYIGLPFQHQIKDVVLYKMLESCLILKQRNVISTVHYQFSTICLLIRHLSLLILSAEICFDFCVLIRFSWIHPKWSNEFQFLIFKFLSTFLAFKTKFFSVNVKKDLKI